MTSRDRWNRTRGFRTERSFITQRMELLLEFTGQGIYGINVQGNCTFINRATCEMIDYRPEEALGRKYAPPGASPQNRRHRLPGRSMPYLPRVPEGGELPGG